MELGIYSFGDISATAGVSAISAEQGIKNLLERARLADEVGLDYYGLGEHHREEYAVSSPQTVLAAAAAQTSNIRLGSAVTVLSTDDPVRVFQQFATADLISGGRVEITAGRGSFIESYPLFGAELTDYEALYNEKIELLLELNAAERVTWSGRFRPALDDALILPRPAGGRLPIWIATGGTPASTVRAAALGQPVIYGLLGGSIASFARHAELFRSEAERLGHGALPVGVSSVGFVAEHRARDTFYAGWNDTMTRTSAERGFATPSRASYEAQAGPEGGIYVGNAEEVAEKIIATHRFMRHDRHILQMDLSALPQREVLRSIELLGTKVKPMLDAELGSVPPTHTSALGQGGQR